MLTVTSLQVSWTRCPPEAYSSPRLQHPDEWCGQAGPAHELLQLPEEVDEVVEKGFILGAKTLTYRYVI